VAVSGVCARPMFRTAMRDLASAEAARRDADQARRDAQAEPCYPCRLFLLWCADQLDQLADAKIARWDFLDD